MGLVLSAGYSTNLSTCGLPSLRMHRPPHVLGVVRLTMVATFSGYASVPSVLMIQQLDVGDTEVHLCMFRVTPGEAL